LVAGSGDREDELFTMNDTGKTIWDQLDGQPFRLRGETRAFDLLEARGARRGTPAAPRREARAAGGGTGSPDSRAPSGSLSGWAERAGCLSPSGILTAMKQRVCVETRVIISLASRPARDSIVAAHQELTREWWEVRSGRFELVISELVEQEAGAGDPDASRSRLAAIEGIAILTLSDEAVSIAERLVGSGPIPREAAADALHIAVAAVNGIDYLLTWNCKHLANASLRVQIGALLEDAGYACPVICTPEELMEG